MSNASAAAAAGTVAAASAAAVLDKNALAQLMDMGFSLNSSKRALTAVGGSSVEAAMEWVFEHNNDPDFNDPLPTDTNVDDDDDYHHPPTTPAATAAAASSSTHAAAAAASSSTSHTTSAAFDRDEDEEAVVQNLVEMLGCFTADKVRFGLKQTHGDANHAADL
ncbi:hypothetical protein ACA910_004627 [Epithemia clementina (nom. ined.)]